ncbi:rabankyrin-5-like isoform X2 [Schistocerca piceifrons]|uniref:rabankyrin-5-like isoform X2 n=1 Tax=Schistocerca piceifrons TaxID=274613 RepID=UPI001F5F857D|nr:rabankyrin-5-like isoform X2 [Schistocerca piceifrons]
MSQLTEFDKGRIIALYQDGYAIRAISRALGFSKSTVHLWVKRMAKEGHVTCRRRSGRPRITTEDQDKSILRCVGEDPYRTRKEIKNMLHLSVSKETIRRRLIEQGGLKIGEFRNGADTDSLSERPKDSYQTLHHSSIDDDNESVSEFLVQSGCDSNASRQLGPGGGGGEGAQNEQPPLHIWGVENVVQALSENGAAINAKDIRGKTALHVAIENQLNGIVSLLLCHPELDLTVRDKAGLTPFAAALKYRNYGVAQAILDRMPAAAEEYDDKGQNFLHISIQKEDMETILFLLSIQVDVNSRVQDTNQMLPLQLAAAAGSETLVRSLMLAGARVDDRDAHQRTALHVAAGAGHAAVISALLQNGADANASDSEGDNALHIACREGQRGSALLFLTESQLDAEAVNLKGRNPLHELAGASKDTAAGIAELFIECIPYYPLDKPDFDGNTALLLAYMEGNGNLCHTLVRFGASLGTMNKDGVTIFDSQGSTKELLHSLLDNLSREPHFTEGDICLECGIKFGVSIHKHHCNHCGRILCSKCSDRAVPILKFGLNKPVRVCTVCFSVLQGPG